MYTAAILALAGLLDALYREVEPAYWYLAAKAGAVIALWDSVRLGLDPFTLGILAALSLAPAAVGYVLYRLCLLGGSDVAAMAFIAVASPAPLQGLPLPPALAATLLSAPYVALYYAYKLWAACGPRCLLKGKSKVAAEDLALSGFYRWWIPRLPGGGESEGCSLEVSPPEAAEAAGGSVEASPGLPLVSMFALGYSTYILVASALA